MSLPFAGASKTREMAQHPIAPLTASEITDSSRLIRELWPSNTNLQFKVITLQEPNKAELLPFLAAEREGRMPSPIERKSSVVYYIRNTVGPPRLFSTKERSKLKLILLFIGQTS
jgi:primary-amine oxidase